MRIALLLSSLLFAFPLLSAFHVSWGVAAIALLVLIVSLRRPEDGLLVIAGLLPLATPLGLLITPALSGRATGELLVLPLLAAATIRFGLRPRPAPTSFGLAAGAGVIVLLCATLTGLARGHNWRPLFDRRHWAPFSEYVTTAYLADAAAYPAFAEGMVWLEGIVLAYVTYLILRETPGSRERVCRMLLIGAAGAALCTANRLAEVFLRNQMSLGATADVLGGVRIGIHVADINALGSYYALFVAPALWLALRQRRLWQWAAFGAIALALQWTGSRAAIVAGCLGMVMVAVYAGAMRRRAIVLGLSVVVAIGLSARAAVRPLSLGDTLRIRTEMAGVGLRLAAGHPGFGVGLGQFRRASRRLISDDMVSRVYRDSGQNAHNNFVQILAELGLVGAGAIAAVVGVPLAMARRTLLQSVASPELAAFTSGVVAFLLTCLLGHPLLTPQCLWPFLLLLGVVAGLSADADRQASGSTTTAARLFMLAVVCSLLWRVP